MSISKEKITDSITEVARTKLGFESLRPGQREAVASILARRDTLVVQPTGSGKSAIYRIAGLLIEGSTVIVSPLIALQKDQVDSIVEQSPDDAVAINSTLTVAGVRDRVERLKRGETEYIFLSPEQLGNSEMVEHLKSANISLFVVDEAHCISEWGHDFRPDYLRLKHVIASLGHPPVLALTATATAQVREEIIERLGMRKPKVFVRGFDRPNIYLRVDRYKSESDKRDDILHRVRWAEKPGIIYTSTRKAAEELTIALRQEAVAALVYHGGMKGKERHEIQERFMSGDVQVIVATNAFGMGIDKADIHFVYHYDPPDSLDSYYQEIGRAGRDGKKAEAVLFYRGADIGAQAYKTSEGTLDPELVEQLVARLDEGLRSVDPADIADDLGLSIRKMKTALLRLEDAGVVETLPNGEVRSSNGADAAEASRSIAENQQRRSQANRERLEQMRDYAETSHCRREMLLRYLGDEFHGPCNSCDNCDSASGKPHVDPGAGTRREVV